MTLGIALLLFAGCRSRRIGNTSAGGGLTARIAVQAVNGSNPAYGIRQVVALLSQEGLTASAPDGRSRPRLADHWTTSPDGLTWHFFLHRNAKFHDGALVDAHTVKSSLDRAIQQGNAAAFPMTDIDSIEAPSQSELVVHLQNPSAFLLDDLSAPVTIPGKGQPVGTGPFSLVSLSATGAVMKSNEDYYRGRPELEQVLLKPYSSLRSAWADMLRGDVDFLYEVGADALDFVDRSSSMRVFKADRPYNYVVFLNQHDDALRLPLVRKALNAGIDRKALVSEGLQGHGTPEYSPVWPENWANDTQAPRFDYDPNQAMRWLDQAGLKLHPGNPATGPAARLTIDCLVPENRTDVERLALVVQAQLAQLGVVLNLQAVNLNEFITRVTSGHFQAAIIDAVAGPTMAFTYWDWHSEPDTSRGMNYEAFRSPAVDAYLDTIRHATNDNVYRSAVSGLQHAMYDDPPAIFLAWSETFRAVSRRFEVPTDGRADLLQSLRLWKPAVSVQSTQ